MERLPDLLDAAEALSEIGCWTYDHADGRLWWSRGLYRMHGLPPGDAPPPSAAYRALVHPEDRPGFTLFRHEQGPPAAIMERYHRIRRPDGATRWIRSRWRSEPGEDGRPARTLGVMQDVTTQQVAWQFLHEGEERYRTLVDLCPDAVFVHLDGRIALANAALCRLLRSDGVRDLMGRPTLSLMDAACQEAARQHLQSILAGGAGNGLMEQRWVRMDGTRVSVEVAGRHLRWHGRPAVQMVARDITERKLLEDIRLERARAEAEHATVAKTRFLASASHDLRQPTQTLLLLQDLLARQNRDPQLAPLIDRLGQTTESLKRLLDALLDISRLDAGTVDITPEDFPIGPMLSRLAQQYDMQARERGGSVRFVDCRAHVRSDPVLLERILSNLLDNAIKYAPGQRVLIGCRRAGGMLRIQVRDTGPGMPEDQLGLIWKEFQRLPDTQHRHPGGMGLGLSIVERLSHLLQHGVSVRSILGRGTLFDVAVPRAAAPTASPPGPASPPRPNGGGRLIAILDDEPSIQEALRMAVEDIGYRAVAAADPDSLAASLAGERTPPHAIIADFRLAHGLSGIDAVARLRARLGIELPAILLTGDTSPDRLRQARASGLRLLHKPVRFDALAKAIEEITPAADASQGPPASGSDP